MAPPAEVMAAAPEPRYYVSAHETDQLLSCLSEWKPSPATPDELSRSGFPSLLTSPLVWKGTEVSAREGEWLEVLSEEDIARIEDGLAHFRGLGLDPASISPETFPLPAELRARLDGISATCYDGIGFTVLRGLDPEKYSEDDNALIFMGISANVATVRAFQDRKRGQVLCHVVNAAVKMEREKVTSPGFTDGAMSFHNDEGEILALYVRDGAETGGRTQVASGWHLYNVLAGKRPDIIKKLAENWVLDSFQDYTQFPPTPAPCIHVKDGKVMFTFSRYPLTGFGPNRKRNKALPPVSEAQLEALNAVEVLARQDAFALPTRKGDVVYMNNLALLHGRESFTEKQQQEQKDMAFTQRHLLKLCLRDPARSWAAPASLMPVWERIYGGNRPDGSREEHCCLQYAPGQESLWARNG
ncbi:hypothetical protein RB595_007212 [Gaeumannomyces hyphopodioides]